MQQEIAQIAYSLSSDANVKGVLLTGSYARGDATPESDLDFWVLLGGVRERPFRTEQINGHWVELHYRNLVQARDKMRQNPMELYSHLDGKPLYDPDRQLEQLRLEASELFANYRPSEPERKALAFWLQSARRKLESAVNNRDALKAAYLVSTSSWKVLEGLWAASNKPTPPSGSVFAHLSDIETPLPPESLMADLFTASPETRVHTTLTLMDWILPRLQGGPE